MNAQNVTESQTAQLAQNNVEREMEFTENQLRFSFPLVWSQQLREDYLEGIKKIYENLETITTSSSGIATLSVSTITTKQAKINAALQAILDAPITNFTEAMVLVRKGANPNMTDHKGRPLIHKIVLAEINGLLFRFQARALIEELVHVYKVDIESKNNITGKTTLQCALHTVHCEGEDAMHLVRCGADPTTTGPLDVPLIHFIATTGNIQWIRELVDDYQVNIDEKNDTTHETTVQYLLNSRFCNLQSVMNVIDYGADPNQFDFMGNSLIHIVMYVGRFDYLQKLVGKHRANIDISDRSGKTIFQLAIEQQIFELAIRIAELGANPYQTNSSGETLTDLLEKDKKHNKAYLKLYLQLLKLQNKYDLTAPSKSHLERNFFLNFLIILSWDLNRHLRIDQNGNQLEQSNSLFSKFAFDTILHLITFFDFKEMRKTISEGSALAKAILFNPLIFNYRKYRSNHLNHEYELSKLILSKFILNEQLILYKQVDLREEAQLAKMVLSKSNNFQHELWEPGGGINVFQHGSEQNAQFTFFRSARVYCKDYPRVKKIKNPDKLQHDAIICWFLHSSLYKNERDKQKLWLAIQDAEPYQKIKIIPSI